MQFFAEVLNRCCSTECITIRALCCNWASLTTKLTLFDLTLTFFETQIRNTEPYGADVVDCVQTQCTFKLFKPWQIVTTNLLHRRLNRCFLFIVFLLSFHSCDPNFTATKVNTHTYTCTKNKIMTEKCVFHTWACLKIKWNIRQLFSRSSRCESSFTFQVNVNVFSALVQLLWNSLFFVLLQWQPSPSIKCVGNEWNVNWGDSPDMTQ